MARVPSIPSAALRDHGSPERVERIWKRIQPNLLPRQRLLLRPAPSLWVPAALVAMFGAGVFVGSSWVRPERTPTFTAERPVAPEPVAGPAVAPREQTLPPAEPPRAAQARKQRVIESAVTEPEAILVEPEVPAPAPQTLPVAPPPEWEQLANADRFAEARAALEARGGFRAVLGTASATELMTLADIARFTGSRDHAIAAVRRVVEAFPEAAVAPEAALTLGNLLEQAGDRDGAAEAYALYRRLSPSGDFAEDTLARQIDAALSQGNLDEFARLVAQYEHDFPNGRRLEEFRAELAKRTAGVPGDTDEQTEPLAPAHPDAAVDATKPPSK